MLTIIGTGLAGYTVAKEFRKLDKTTPLRLITSDDGCFYSKPMLSNALAQNKTPASLATYSAEQMAEQFQLEILTHTEVMQVNPSTRQLQLAEGKTLSYDRLVFAHGAAQVRSHLDGEAAKHIITINDLQDYQLFRNKLHNVKRVTILGAGLIGCEFANDLCSVGISVQVIDFATYPLSRLIPATMGSILKNALTSLGVDWHFGRIIKRIETTEQQGYRLFFSDQEFLETDLVLSAIGLRPRTELAAQAGLTVKQGIAVNRYLQSSDPHIYALGDCAEVEGLVLPYILPLMNAARALAKTLAGQQTAVEYPAMPIVVKTPICPTVISPPRMGAVGNWEFEGSGNDTKALFYSPQRELLGCVLMGKTTSERLALTKILPAFF